jgi:hypothetical protein
MVRGGTAMKDEKQRPPLLRATVDVDWVVGGKKHRLTPDDEPTRDVPPKVAAWMLRCGALVETRSAAAEGEVNDS